MKKFFLILASIMIMFASCTNIFTPNEEETSITITMPGTKNESRAISTKDSIDSYTIQMYKAYNADESELSARSRNPVKTFTAEPGETVTVYIPAGFYYAYFAANANGNAYAETFTETIEVKEYKNTKINLNLKKTSAPFFIYKAQYGSLSNTRLVDWNMPYSSYSAEPLVKDSSGEISSLPYEYVLDKNGNRYTIDYSDPGNIVNKETYNPAGNKFEEESDFINTIEDTNQILKLAYDAQTDTIASLYADSSSKSEIKYKKTTDATEKTIKLQTNMFNNSDSNIKMAFSYKDKICVIYKMYDDDFNLVLIKFSDEPGIKDEYCFTAFKKESLPFTFCQQGKNAIITDIAYSSGKVFMLLKENNMNVNEKFNYAMRGALLIFDTSLNFIGSKGWASKKEQISVNQDNPVVIDFYSPNAGNGVFFGPDKFLCVTPKKLLIADDGFSWEWTSKFESHTRNGFVEYDIEKDVLKYISFDEDIFDETMPDNGSGMISFPSSGTNPGIEIES